MRGLGGAKFAQPEHAGPEPPDPLTRRFAPPSPEGRGDDTATARLVSYRNTEIVAEADAPQGGWLVLNDVFHPWWFAEVDGLPAPMLRANVLFRAVAVPPGRHRVRFVFRPFAGLLAQLREALTPRGGGAGGIGR